MPRCSDRNCECNKCSDCNREHNSCICDLIERTKRLLSTDMDNYDFTARAKYILREWLDA